jgi:hypothetical protein
VDVWWALEMQPQASRGSHFCNAVGRLRQGVSLAQASAEFNAIAGRLAQQFPNTNKNWRIAIKFVAGTSDGARTRNGCAGFAGRWAWSYRAAIAD